MNRILKYVFGTVEAELVSADPAAALTYYSAQGLRLQDPELTAPLTLTMTMAPHTWRRLEPMAQARGDRCRGIRQLTSPQGAPDTEVILLDDAFQHRYVRPGLRILLMDYHRPVECDQLLPAGRLREPASGKKRADLLIVTKCPPNLSQEECERIRQRIHPLPHQEVFFTTLAYGKLYPLFMDAPTQPLDVLKDKEVLLVTGIASPAPLMEEVGRHAARITPLLFGDHHNFDGADMQQIAQQFHKLPETRRLILTTEKDASRLIGHPQLCEELKPYIYVLPIEVEFLHKGELVFNPKIIEYVRKNSRNSSLSKG